MYVSRGSVHYGFIFLVLGVVVMVVVMCVWQPVVNVRPSGVSEKADSRTLHDTIRSLYHTTDRISVHHTDRNSPHHTTDTSPSHHTLQSQFTTYSISFHYMDKNSPHHTTDTGRPHHTLRSKFITTDSHSVHHTTSSSPHHTCQSLFTTTAVSEDHDTPWTPPTTQHYQALADLLPSLLSFTHGAPHLNATSHRITTHVAHLPFVPCAILPYHAPASVTACLTRRSAARDSLWIEFMGDSIIRELFYQFLQRSDSAFHYSVWLPAKNKTVSFLGLRESHPKLKTDMIATTPSAPDLRITYRFRTFAYASLKKLRGSEEAVRLRRWVEGQDHPPHLLVVGYGSWTMGRSWEAQESTIHALDLLMATHSIIVPLLHKVSQMTRVIVVPQHRYRPHARQPGRDQMRVPFFDTTFDWADTMFLHHLRRLHQRDITETASPISLLFPPPPPIETKKAKRVSTRVSSEHHAVREADSRVSSTAITSFQTKTLAETRSRVSPVHLPYFETQKAKRIPIDYLNVNESGGGVWWWDTSLPLGLADISDCRRLYQRGLSSHPVYLGTVLRCTDDHHPGSSSLTDQVTMLLNLICNSGVTSQHHICCS